MSGELTTQDVIGDLSDLICNELGWTHAKLLKKVALSLKAYKIMAGEKHPDFREIREAAKDLLALLNIVAPTKHEVKGQLSVNIQTYTVADLEEALKGGK